MKKYFSFVKIEHTVFSLPVIYAGMMLGLLGYKLDEKALPSSDLIWQAAILALIAATGARTAGFALNRIIDRHIDARNPRTSMRDLPSGRMSLRQAYIVLIAGTVVYLTAAYLLNPLCLMLSPIPLLVFIVYPFMKRFTKFAHFGVGLSLALGPAGGYVAVRPYIDEQIIPVLLLVIFTWLWVSGFDIIYSTSDEEFDKREGLYSFPAVFGKLKALRYSLGIHAAAFLFLAAIALMYFPHSFLALILLLIIAVLLYLENKKADDVELAFFHINTVVGFVVLLYILIPVLQII